MSTEIIIDFYAKRRGAIGYSGPFSEKIEVTEDRLVFLLKCQAMNLYDTPEVLKLYDKYDHIHNLRARRPDDNISL